MKISVNDTELFSLSDMQKKVIQHEISSELFEADMKRRLQWVLMHKYERVMEDFKREWMPKLKANGVTSIPLDDEEFAALVFGQPNYKDRSTRDAEARARGEIV